MTDAEPDGADDSLAAFLDARTAMARITVEIATSGADSPLPDFYWEPGRTDMACMRSAVTASMSGDATGVAISAWWPGGRTAQKAFSSSPAITAATKPFNPIRKPES